MSQVLLDLHVTYPLKNAKRTGSMHKLWALANRRPRDLDAKFGHQPMTGTARMPRLSLMFLSTLPLDKRETINPSGKRHTTRLEGKPCCLFLLVYLAFS